eukprot:4859672-Prorocentrum_lima.AAC.1
MCWTAGCGMANSRTQSSSHVPRDGRVLHGVVCERAEGITGQVHDTFTSFVSWEPSSAARTKFMHSEVPRCI